MRPLIVIFILLPFFHAGLTGQIIQKPVYQVGISSLPYFGDNTPFWFVSNENGKYLPDGFNNLLELGFSGDLSPGENFSLGYGIEAVSRQNNGNKTYLNQAYLESKIYFINILLGAKNRSYGNEDSTLSSGALLYSGNARPIPKIGIGTNGYTEVPFTRGYLELDGYLEHGWFEYKRDDWMDEPRHVKDVLLHHKYVKVRIGGDLPVRLQYGLEHFTQYGGTSPDFEQPFPASFEAYRRIFFAQSGDSTLTDVEGEITNQLGNHLGGRIMGMDIRMKDYHLNVYWQTIFEDGSGMKWRNVEDGLWGISIRMKDKNQFVSGICAEFLRTLDQSGPVHDNELGLRGNDNYFNNYIYRSGWSHYGMTIGNPFITSPIYNEKGDHFRNNKVLMQHYGFEGNIYKELYYQFLFSFHSNFGTNGTPFDPPKDFLSTALKLRFPVHLLTGLHVTTAFGMDTGHMYGYNYGFMIKLSKTGRL